MSESLELPAFESEEAEANWWYEHREERDAAFIQAMADGRVKRNNLAQRLARARGVPFIDMQAEDVAKAKSLAERASMEVATYLSLLIHEALERETKLAS